MHRIDISTAIAARAKAARGGSETLIQTFDPARTAHIIIDMQNGFVAPGAVVEIPVAREIVPAINRISQAVRQAGGINIFVQFVVDEASLAGWSNFYGGIFTPDFAAAMAKAFAPGSHGHQLFEALDVRSDDLKVDKSRFGAFVPGTSDLAAMLHAREIDTLIITGTATNVCCETTAREAMQRNYRVVLVSDATAAVTDVEHNAALNSLTAIFADVVTTDAVLQALASSVG
jgi:ureidoacrylate peracid hydrolase